MWRVLVILPNCLRPHEPSRSCCSQGQQVPQGPRASRLGAAHQNCLPNRASIRKRVRAAEVRATPVTPRPNPTDAGVCRAGAATRQAAYLACYATARPVPSDHPARRLPPAGALPRGHGGSWRLVRDQRAIAAWSAAIVGGEQSDHRGGLALPRSLDCANGSLPSFLGQGAVAVRPARSEGRPGPRLIAASAPKGAVPGWRQARCGWRTLAGGSAWGGT